MLLSRPSHGKKTLQKVFQVRAKVSDYLATHGFLASNLAFTRFPALCHFDTLAWQKLRFETSLFDLRRDMVDF